MSNHNAFRKILAKAETRQDLDEDEAESAFLCLTQDLPSPLIAEFLTALHHKGESLSEIVGAAKAALKGAKPFPKTNGMLVDIVGTGGDQKNTGNVSTLAALTVASLGIPVAKHGNRAASSQCGSADLLEQFGLSLELEPEKAHQQLLEYSFTFLFAPYYHSGFKNVAQIRKTLGFRTIFNVLGPLINPANPTVQLLGVFEPSLLEKIALALKKLGRQRAWVVHGGSGSDELDLEGENLIFSLENGTIQKLTLTAKDAGLPQTPLSKIQGNTKDSNTAVARRTLQGEPGPLHDIVALNAGAAVYLCGRAKTLREGVEMAKETLTKGAAWNLVENLRQKRIPRPH